MRQDGDDTSDAPCGLATPARPDHPACPDHLARPDLLAWPASVAHILLRTRDQLRAQLEEVAATLDDLAQAVAQERREQELGIPSLALATLQAHLYDATAAMSGLQAVLTQAETLCKTLCLRSTSLDASPQFWMHRAK